jgi:dephospho-CoA kinase
MMRPFCVGLTGGIGCGKSTVADMLADLGAAVVDTDVIARELTGATGAAIADIVAAFGADALTASGELDRAAMRARVFADRGARERLQDILHPLILEAAARRVGAAEAPYALLVVPLLVESLPRYRALVDRVAVVDCERAQQLARAATRPGLDEAQARAIVDAQIGAAARLAVADDVIANRAGLDALRARVAELHAKYLAMAKEKRRNNDNAGGNALH